MYIEDYGFLYCGGGSNVDKVGVDFWLAIQPTPLKFLYFWNAQLYIIIAFILECSPVQFLIFGYILICEHAPYITI
jgi:hypothetical protein